MHKNKWPIAKLTFAALCCLQILTLALMLLIAHFGGEDAYLTHVKRLMKAVASESVENVESLLNPAETLVVTTASLMEANVISVSPDEKLEKFLFENIRTNNNFSGMYFGWNNGDFLYVTRSKSHDSGPTYLSKIILKKSDGTRETQLISRNRFFKETQRRSMNAGFDPRTRPWFAALAKGSIRWTQPYVFYTSQNPGVTVSIPVVNSEGEPIGVLGLDIEVAHLSSFLSKNALSDNSLSMIATDDHRMVAYSNLASILKPTLLDNEVQELVTVKEMDDECINGALQALKDQKLSFVSDEVREVDFEHEGQRHHAVFHSYKKSGVNWSVIVISPESDFLSSIRNAQFKQAMLAIIGSLLLTLLAFLITRRFLKPVEALQETVLRNPLTGLYNRRALDELGSRLIKTSQKKGQVVSIAIVDIDRFKTINDSFGHSIGDEVLISVSQRMQNVMKQTDLLVRYGGEEFVLLFFGADIKVANAICERLRKAIQSSTIQTRSGGIPVTISVGVSEIASSDDTYHTALDLADQALFIAKRNGRNRVCNLSDIDLVGTTITDP